MSPVSSVVGCLALGYLSGSLPWGLWLGRAFRGVDVRTMGSGNLGATNVFRSLGRGLGLLTLLLDMLKGAIPVIVVPATPLADHFPGGALACALAVGLAAVAGHIWTFLAGFRGGKGVATSAGVLFAISPYAFTAFAVVFVVTVVITRYISLGSMLGSIAFATATAWMEPRGVRSPLFLFALVLAALVVLRHRENIQRLRAGTERRFSWKGGPA